jgi:hypothetical protein
MIPDQPLKLESASLACLPASLVFGLWFLLRRGGKSE